jgi:hypothetical protein
MAHDIGATRAEFGGHNLLCERFLELCSLGGPNVPGEPKLAAMLLAEIDQDL